MKKLLSLGFILFILSFSTRAQLTHHKIIFDVSGKDTVSQSLVLRQVNNILKAAPEAKLEIVFHGNAVLSLVKKSTVFQTRIEALAQNPNVVFAACNNSMKRLKIDKSELLSAATVVPLAILELSEKQQQGWSYIKVVD